jgi:hypothetical protein
VHNRRTIYQICSKPAASASCGRLRDFTSFVKSGALRGVQRIDPPQETPLRQNIDRISSLFSEAATLYYKPEYEAEILPKILEKQQTVRNRLFR